MTFILIVTGGGRGIGAETSLRAAEAGWDVCISYRSNASRAREIAGKVEAAGRRALIVQADIGSEADILRLFETCEAELGTPSGLVNSAGILEPLSRRLFFGCTNGSRCIFVTSLLCARMWHPAPGRRRLSALRAQPSVEQRG